jgi:carboxylesterase type B
LFVQVKNHITTFGGDPQNITGIGESAGAGKSGGLSSSRLHD